MTFIISGLVPTWRRTDEQRRRDCFYNTANIKRSVSVSGAFLAAIKGNVNYEK